MIQVSWPRAAAALTAIAVLAGWLGDYRARAESQALNSRRLDVVEEGVAQHETRMRRLEAAFEVIAFVQCSQLRERNASAALPRACREVEP